MVTVFISSILFIFYTYALFPVFLHLRAKNKPSLSIVDPKVWPSVSIVIAARNEEPNLTTKIKTLQNLDYPAELLEWVFVSDGSTDGTQALLENAFTDHPNRHVLHLEKSLGKCGALNAGVAKATGEIILFMDARQPVSNNAVKKLIPFLSDPSVGAVSGELVLSEDSSVEAGNFGLYWRYEKWIRDNESRLFSTTGATGALYAIRRADFTPNKLGTLLDDFDTPASLLKLGKRTLFVQGAYAFDQAADDLKQEFRRKVRTSAGRWQSCQNNTWLFNPLRNPVWWQFLSHNVFRLLVPYAIIAAFVSAVFGDGLFMNAMLILQLIFYAIAAASYKKLPGTGNKIFNMVVVFLQLNLAAFVATGRFFLTQREISWR
ncbi:MAG: biofilm PGA synthesis N-glycosyltransferase PgaC [bacterium]|jgi:cellulose synthase/poly-beta-1,6-N-acetylglucosamine synthase-like glycosyltransferase